MGGQWSSTEEVNEREPSPDPFWPSNRASTSNSEKPAASDKAEDGTERRRENEKKLEEFKQELAGKREVRHKAIVGLSEKLKQLQAQVKNEADARKAAEAEVERLNALLREAEGHGAEEMKKKIEELEKDKEEKDNEVYSLRRVASIGKEMLRIRELQVNELKKKLCETETYPSGLRLEYEAQLRNVKRLKSLYEEKAEATRLEHQRELEREIARAQALEKKVIQLERERKQSESAKDQLKCHISKLDEALVEENDQTMTLREQLDASLLECRDLSSQMALVNNLFSKVLLGNIDVNRLTRLLQENQSLMTDLTSNGGARNDLAALLLKIVEQIDSPLSETNEANQGSASDVMTEEQVALNLSKVWQILVQLLAKSDSSPSDCDSDSCYKSVETPSGTKSVISVSQTFITLKTLILEKNSLINEVGKLKSLNDHLETRLGSQEKRLAIVSTELKKTWGVVSKLRAQHKQLHTQEKILRYELQHKRQLLNELKEELERCRDKWTMARKKNTQSEEDWRKLRKEFAERKNRQVSTSAESGYEDEELRSPPTEDNLDDSSAVEQNDDEVTESEELEFSENELSKADEEIFNSSRTSFYMSGENNSSSSIQSTDTVIRVDLNDQLLILDEPSVMDQSTNSEECDKEEASILQNCERLQKETEDSSISESEDIVHHQNELTAPNESENSGNDNISDDNLSMTHQRERKFSNVKIPCTRDSCSAENISKFLDGLLVPDDNVESLDSVSCTVEKSIESKLVPDVSNVNLSLECDNCACGSSSDSSSIDQVPFKSDCEEEKKVCDKENSLSIRPSEEVTENAADNKNDNHECSSSSSSQSIPSTTETHKRTAEEVLDARTARLKRLEEQCKQLFNKVTATSHKSNFLSSKLELLHEQYGGGSNRKPDEETSEEVLEASSDATSSEQDAQEASKG